MQMRYRLMVLLARVSCGHHLGAVEKSERAWTWRYRCWCVSVINEVLEENANRNKDCSRISCFCWKHLPHARFNPHLFFFSIMQDRPYKIRAFSFPLHVPTSVWSFSLASPPPPGVLSVWTWLHPTKPPYTHTHIYTLFLPAAKSNPDSYLRTATEPHRRAFLHFSMKHAMEN